jgi:hypothetical protein
MDVDYLYSLALKMKGRDLMELCSTDQKTRKICTSEKFNPIWIRNLLDDFNLQYSGNEAYIEYLQHAYLYKQTYWVATIFNKYIGHIVTSKIFKNREDAAIFLANKKVDDKISRHCQFEPFKISEIFAYFKELGSFEDQWNRYEISKSEFETKPETNRKYTSKL